MMNFYERSVYSENLPVIVRFSLPYGVTFTNQLESTRIDSIVDSEISFAVISLPDCSTITNDMSKNFVDTVARLTYQ